MEPQAPPLRAETAAVVAAMLQTEEAPVLPLAADPAQPGVGVRIKSLKYKADPKNSPSEGARVIQPDLGLNVETLTPVKKERRKKAKTAQPAADLTTPKVKSKRGRKSLKEVAAEAELIEIPADEVLFTKQYYTMGEVAGMFKVNQSLLRFWETEFDVLQPRKNKKGDRYFRPIDIKNLHLIYHLLRQRKYTIEGAKDFLKKNKKADEKFEVIRRLQEIKAFLLEMKAQL